MLKLLLDRGADPNRDDGQGISPLMWASNKPEELKLLLTHGAKVNRRGENGMTPMEWALYNCSHDGIPILKGAGAVVHPEKAKR